MRFKTTFLLAVVFAGLGLYLFLIEFPQEQKKEAQAEKASRVYSFNSKEVSGLIVQYPNMEEIGLTKDGAGKWQMTRPIETPASRTLINKIIGLMTDSLEFKQTVEEKPTDLRSFGLDPPQILIALKFPDHEEQLLIGDDAPASSAYYIKKGQESRILLVDHQVGDLKRSLEDVRSVKAWRKKEIAELASDKLQTVRLDYGDRAVTLAKEGNQWWIREPLQALADRLTVDGLIQTVSGLMAEDFIDDKKPQEQKKFGPPKIILTLSGESQNQIVKFYQPARPTLPVRQAEAGDRQAQVKKEDDRFYAVSSPEEPIYVLKGKWLDNIMQKDLYALRDKTVLNIQRSAVQEMRVQTRPESFSLFKKDDGWRTDDQKTKVDKEKVTKLLDELDLLKAQKFVEDNPKNLSLYGLAEPQQQVMFYDKDKKLLGKLLLGKVQGDQVYAVSDYQPSVVLVKKAILDSIHSKTEFTKKS